VLLGEVQVASGAVPFILLVDLLHSCHKNRSAMYFMYLQLQLIACALGALVLGRAKYSTTTTILERILTTVQAAAKQHSFCLRTSTAILD
jgi:hypothetical protein